jgi:hypothetical protein
MKIRRSLFFSFGSFADTSKTSGTHRAQISTPYL